MLQQVKEMFRDQHGTDGIGGEVAREPIWIQSLEALLRAYACLVVQETRCNDHEV